MTEPASQSAPEPAQSTRQRVRAVLVQLGFLPVAVALLLGMLAGIGGFTFGYGEGAAYLSNDPAACANCHVMQDHYDTWQKSSHHGVATCNDCHLPHNFVGKWMTKGDNGFFHSLAFTTNNYPQPLQIKARNRRVTQNACLYCHGEFVHNMLPTEPKGDMALCAGCHSDVGHSARRRAGWTVEPRPTERHWK